MLIRWQKTIVDRQGNVQPGAVLTIRRESDQALVTIYRDRDGTNPYPTGTVTADENGYAYFYALADAYRITSLKPAIDWRDEGLTTAIIDFAGKTYLSYDSPSDKRMVDDTSQPVGTLGRVTNDADPEKNGDWVMTAAGWEWAEVQPAKQADVAELQGGLGFETMEPASVAVALYDNERVAVWLDAGRLDAMGLGPRLSVAAKALSRTAISESIGTSSIAALASYANERVPVWLDGGLLDAMGFGPRLTQAIQATAGNDSASSVPTFLDRDLPLRTDGSSLRRWLAKLGLVKAGVGQARILLTGDSWTEHLTITQALAAVLHAEFGRAGTGWLSFDPQYYLDGVTGSRTGGTLFDATNDPQPGPPMGCGPDGFALYWTTAGDAITFGNLVHGDTFTVFFGAQTGSFRWRVDGGAWTTVTPNPAGAAVQSTVIALATGSAHTVQMEWVSGTVALFGQLLRDSTAVGVEVLKVGQGGATGYDFMTFADWVQPFAAALDVDVTVQILGTNDFRRTRASIESFKAAHEMLIDAYRSANADCGSVVAVPMKSNGSTVIPLIRYRDAAWETAKARQVEFINGFDAWDSFSIENSRGQWADGAHVSEGGAHRFVRQQILPTLGV
ncbi:SGNH/GDSL hydrolase family protein [Bordetella genomosp. 4]|uniref:SGNH hydrolase-type esterase domain-containing protein n=1 Tax=Bordetella genomosp. 4 TaxID=463044 RepID=A0A261U799_9BORD|nr:SGNH/GDSL hydrolase family protein [Bordetella genomosp. 4]OZI56733.1 hypothetical protein CAL20_15135 [Bordetella genomosp. 4]